MKSINTYLTEKFRVNKDMVSIKYIPKTSDELREIIDKRTKNIITDENGDLDFNDIDVSNISDFSQLFNGKQRAKTIDISCWDMSKCTSFEGMFSGCLELRTIYLNPNKKICPKTLDFMFFACPKLENIDFIKNIDMSDSPSCAGMFMGCRKLSSSQKNKIMKLFPDSLTI